MPKKFDENEKKQLQHKLLAAGRTLFSRYGFKKTTVGELAQAAGIATGTFYLFYRSKEALFYDLMEQEEQHMQQTLIQQFASGPPNKDAFRLFFRSSFDLITESPILREVLLPSQRESILRHVPLERLNDNYDSDVQKLTPLIRHWQAHGVLRKDADPVLVISTIRSVILLSLHKEAIGESVYDATMELMITAIAEGMRPKEED
ncbi:TetR/AcrR family transcriptional regulator [Paenibacillus sp. 1P07SE]|uniref:TetR/AcrR family transcriptional regulator n=1 Tax=Paenibacillus sp. 1P07SE TaxID=3132209 RepID=UPI0039A44F2F